MPLIPTFDPATTPGSTSSTTAVVSGIMPAGLPGAGTRVALGLTKGGAGIDTNVKWRAAEYDGRRGIIAGMEEVVGYGSKMTATVIEFSAKALGLAIPGQVAVGDGFSPIDANLRLEVGQYITLPWYQLPLIDGRILTFEFPLGIVTEWPIDTKDQDEANMKFTIESRLNPNAPDFRVNMPDFRYFYETP